MPKVPKTKIVVGDHFAEILVRYSEIEPAVYYWLCQKFESAEILGLGTSSTFENAEREAKECLNRLTNGGSCDVERIGPLNFRV